MNNTLLFEIGTEEIPAKFMPRILDELRTRAETMLADARLSPERRDVWHSLLRV